MNGILVLIVTLIYAATSCTHFWAGNIPMGILFAGYAFANIGLIMMS